MYYPSSENKGADQLRGYREADLRLCFRICKLLVFPMRRLKYFHIIGNSALDFGVMLKPQVVGSVRHGFSSQSIFSQIFFFAPLSEHQSYFHAIRVLHDNLVCCLFASQMRIYNQLLFGSHTINMSVKQQLDTQSKLILKSTL